MIYGDYIQIRALIEEHIQHKERKEIPCKDMDLDCLPGPGGSVPFGGYERCYAYDSEQGLCPFMPFSRARH
ncbi:hypothetical protein ACFL6I_09005 [candidate division KSB1 bacterium]